MVVGELLPRASQMNILRLIKKDLWLQRSFALPLILIEVGGVLIFRIQMPWNLSGLLFLLTVGVALVGDFLICYRTMLAEEKNRAMLFLRALPLSTEEIIAAKFAVNLLMVTLNLLILFGLYAIAQQSGRFGTEPPLELTTFAGVVLLHWLANSFFVTISMSFHSEKAVWVPFPALFLIMTVILNFQKIVAALNLQPVVNLATENGAVSLFLLLLVPVAMWLFTVRLVRFKRMFG